MKRNRSQITEFYKVGYILNVLHLVWLKSDENIRNTSSP